MTENNRFQLLLAVAVLVLLLCVTTAYLTYPAISGSEKRLKVSLLYRGSRADAFNDMALTGAAKARLFGDKVSIREVKTLEAGNNQEFALRLQAQSQADLIVCVGYDYTDAVRRVAQEYPKTRYVVIDGYIPDLTQASNITCVRFSEKEGAFLMGTAAALRSTSGIIGFIGGVDNDFMRNFENGYTAGARYINPHIQVLVDYIGANSSAFYNPERAFGLSVAQFAAGADVIFHAAGASGLGVLEAAVGQKKLMIGVDSDQSLSARDDQRPYILTSMVKRVDSAVYRTIDLAIHHSLPGGYYDFGLKQSGIDYAENEYNAALLQPLKPTLDEIKQKIIEKTIRF